MNLSLKHMLISFVAALVLFSVIMTVVCVSIFRDRVDEGLVPSGGLAVDELPVRHTVYAFSDATVYYAEENGCVSLAALVCVSEAERIATVTVLEKSLPVRYKNGIYFVSSICEEEGPDALLNIAEAVTGIGSTVLVEAGKNGVPSGKSAAEFAMALSSLYEDRYGYDVRPIQVIRGADGVVDHTATIGQFFVTEK